MTKQAIQTYKNNLEKWHNLKLEILPKNSTYEIGKTYFSGYWRESYKVINYEHLPENWMGYKVTTLWQDGRTTSHCTDLKEDDFLVIN